MKSKIWSTSAVFLFAFFTSFLRIASAAPPGNDNFPGANIGNGVTNGTTVDATPEPNEPLHAAITNEHSIWYSYSNSASGTLAITSSGSAVSGVLLVYTGNSYSSLQSIAGDVNGSGPSQTTLGITPNLPYRIVFSTFGEGATKLTLTFTPSNPPPPPPTPTPTVSPTAVPTPTPVPTVPTTGVNLSSGAYMVSFPYLDNNGPSASAVVDRLFTIPMETATGNNYYVYRWDIPSSSYVQLTPTDRVNRGESYRLSVASSGLSFKTPADDASLVPLADSYYTYDITQSSPYAPRAIGFPFDPAAYNIASWQTVEVDVEVSPGTIYHYPNLSQAVAGGIMAGGVTPSTNALAAKNTTELKPYGGYFTNIYQPRVWVTLRAGSVGPYILDFTPKTGTAGDSVTITGYRMNDTTRVDFTGGRATIVSKNATQVVVTVPNSARTGPISIGTTNQTFATTRSDYVVTYPNGRADLAIRTPNLNTFTGSDLYGATSSQTAKASTLPSETATYILQLKNSGNGAGTFKITGPAGDANCTIRYFNAEYGGSEITSAVTTTGSTTGSLAVNGTLNYRVEVTPNSSTIGQTKSVTVIAAPTSGAGPSDAVQADTTTRGYGAADLRGRLAANPDPIGDDIVNSTGQGQTLNERITVGVASTYNFSLLNKGGGVDKFKLVANAGNAAYQVKFFDAGTGGTDVTSAFTGSGYFVNSLAAGGNKPMRVQITPQTGAANTQFTLDITASSASNSSPSDTFKVVVTVSSQGYPDLRIRRIQPDSQAVIGDGVITESPESQTAEGETVPSPTTAVAYNIVLRNRGQNSSTFRITANGFNASNTTLTYYDVKNTTWVDRTSAITGTGFVTPVLAPDETYPFRLELKPNSNLSGYYQLSIITATPDGNPTVKDVVQAKTYVEDRGVPDLSIQNGSSSFVGEGIINLDGSGQTVQDYSQYPQAVPYFIEIFNKGTMAGTFKITGHQSGTRWSVKYYNAASGGTEITSQVIGSGWTTPTINSASSILIRAVVTPIDGTLPIGQSRSILVTADATVGKPDTDTVGAITTLVNQDVTGIQYRLNQTSAWQNVPGSGQPGYPLSIDSGQEVYFKAVKLNPSQQWPAETPLWSGDGGVAGIKSEDVPAIFSVAGGTQKTISVTAGSTVSATIQVRGRYSLEIQGATAGILAGGTPSALATTTVTALVKDSSGTPMANKVVQFTCVYDDGTPAGQLGALANSSDDQATTNAQGKATIQIKSTSKITSAIITGSVQDVHGAVLGKERIAFLKPDCVVEFGSWQGSGTVKTCPVTITVRHTATAGTISGLPMAVSELVRNLDGSDASAEIQDILTISPLTGSSNSSGQFNATLTWTPNSSTPGATPSQYDIWVFVDATTMEYPAS